MSPFLFALTLTACCIPIGPSDSPGPDGPTSSSTSKTPPPPPLPPLPPAPASLGDPAASAAARPDWASSGFYAPQASPEVLSLARPTTGPVREGLLACTVRSNLVENHIRKRNNVPDLDVQLDWRDASVSVRGADNTAEVFVSAPLVSLDPGESVTTWVWDRGLILRRRLGSVSLPHTGFPLSGSNEGLDLNCGLVSREALEPLVARHLEDAGRQLVGWTPAADLQAEQVGTDAQGSAALDSVELAAALVGWADPRVQARVRQYGERRAEHLAALRAAIDDQRSHLTTGWRQVGALDWASGTVREVDGDLRVQIPVRPRGEPIEQFAGLIPDLSEVQIIDAEGHQTSLIYGGIGPDGNDTSSPLRAEDTATFSGMIDNAADWRPPMLLRARVAGAWTFMAVEPRGG